MRQIFRDGLILLLLMSPCALAWGGAGVGEVRDSQRELRVGVLASLTGTWSSLGLDTVAGLQIAARKIEAEAHSRGGHTRVRLYVYDTQLDPSLALEGIKEFDRMGIRVIIGPQSSAEVAMIKDYADRHNILVISQGSTASSLAIPGDNIFRMCPDDSREAAAITALMWHDGIRTVVPLWRDDAGNQGLHDSVQTAFQNLGGTVTPGFRYEPTTMRRCMGACWSCWAHADPDRILQEAAMLAERSDIQEEVVRMKNHIQHFLSLLEAGGEVGKLAPPRRHRRQSGEEDDVPHGIPENAPL